MLLELHIQNLALIENQTISFAPGLNVLSGETGAGKSIVLHALEIILGGKAKPHSIRDGSSELEVQALFALPEGLDREVLELPDTVQGSELVVTRTLNASGRGKVYINGKLATLTMLEGIASKLIHICGQSAHVRLLDPVFHLSVIDDFAGNEPLLGEYLRVFLVWKKKSEELQRMRVEASRSEARIEELTTAVQELEAAKITSGIRMYLEQEIRRIGAGEKILQEASQISSLLDDEEGVISNLKRIDGLLHEMQKLDDQVAPMGMRLTSALIELSELSHQLTRYGSSLDVPESHLEDLRDRLAEVARLERKYKTQDQGLLDILNESQTELQRLLGGLSIEKMETEVQALYEQLISSGKSLSSARLAAGKKISKLVEHELTELNMKGASISLQLEEIPPTATGIDKGELFFSANKGERPKPLRQVASGGELSRLTLVLKKVLRDRSGVNVMVFDEVDTGISGSVARAVGQKLKSLSDYSQVLCITHLAQVASLADHHLFVSKQEGERTVTQIRTLDEDERTEEIARMLSGTKVTKAARESARELLSER